MSRKGSAAVHGCVGEKAPQKPEDLSMRILTPLKEVLIIDLVVASVLMSMGMMMLPPVVASLPFKLISLFSSMAGLIKLWNIERARRQAALFARFRRSSAPFLMERLRTAQRYASDNS
jgi:hypothetical protein